MELGTASHPQLGLWGRGYRPQHRAAVPRGPVDTFWGAVAVASLQLSSRMPWLRVDEL